MPLLDEHGRAVADAWVRVADDAPLPEGPAILTAARLRAEDLSGRNAPLGIALDPATAPEAVADLLPRLSLVTIALPKAKDGRAFTQARALREHAGFRGEIRATGHVLPDQWRMLRRCGVTTVEVPEGADLAQWRRSFDVVDIAFQPAQDSGSALGLRRQRLRVA
ncbi:DUF934 domain-containing protein [Paracraurococcus ruber]|uniref:DUF934 domain-containing protein n=1 Tax=Paracraurococcus ruber TaxID=77675 RepID=A0ABS1CZL1_9PROT|nr:DUF934 domain-containing protein [Paracraurococcus ruber]MBK1659981.1 hypothetical protein [Paracraurococcus ruber]TDG28783.1 DUF934 domain-containing protein [Paracraurococcus ruber]